MQRAAAIPKNTKINYHDHTLPVQARLFKSLKLWSFYVDLEESLGTVESAKAVYDKILELRIANAQIIINYAAFLEENKYFEDSFKVQQSLVSSCEPPDNCDRYMSEESNCSHSLYHSKYGTRICPSL